MSKKDIRWCIIFASWTSYKSKIFIMTLCAAESLYTSKVLTSWGKNQTRLRSMEVLQMIQSLKSLTNICCSTDWRELHSSKKEWFQDSSQFVWEILKTWKIPSLTLTIVKIPTMLMLRMNGMKILLILCSTQSNLWS